jgi:hypothetical protein
MSNFDARVIDAVQRAARRYWSTEASGEVQLVDTWIDSRQANGDVIVKVEWISDDPRVTLRDEMIYTVSVLDGDELDVFGPEW